MSEKVFFFPAFQAVALLASFLI